MRRASPSACVASACASSGGGGPFGGGKLPSRGVDWARSCAADAADGARDRTCDDDAPRKCCWCCWCLRALALRRDDDFPPDMCRALDDRANPSEAVELELMPRSRCCRCPRALREPERPWPPPGAAADADDADDDALSDLPPRPKLRESNDDDRPGLWPKLRESGLVTVAGRSRPWPLSPTPA